MVSRIIPDSPLESSHSSARHMYIMIFDGKHPSGALFFSASKFVFIYESISGIIDFGVYVISLKSKSVKDDQLGAMEL